MATPPDSPYTDFIMTFETTKPIKHTRPIKLEELCKQTKFSRQEIRLMYRGFKQECPEGVVMEDTFKEIYAKFFPHGNSSLYAHHVFKTFDLNSNGQISFRDLLMTLSQLLRGSCHDKLKWAFQLYDVNGDGCITRAELADIVSSVHELLGRANGHRQSKETEEVEWQTGQQQQQSQPLPPPSNIFDESAVERDTSTSFITLSPSSIPEQVMSASAADELEATTGGVVMEDRQIREHIDRLFKKFDINGDGLITVDEFIQSCMQDEVISESLKVFEGL